MIEFLIDHETREPKPQRFASGDRVTRAGDTEAFFVRLGVAAFVEGDDLLDADGRPIVTTSVADDRVLIGVEAPQRGTTGPGNALLFGGDQQSVGAQVELARLRETAATSDATLAQLHDEYGRKLDLQAADHDQLVMALTAERDDARGGREQLDTLLAETNRKSDDLALQVQNLTAERDAAVRRAEVAEAALAEKAGGDGTAKTPAKK